MVPEHGEVCVQSVSRLLSALLVLTVEGDDAHVAARHADAQSSQRAAWMGASSIREKLRQRSSLSCGMQSRHRHESRLTRALAVPSGSSTGASIIEEGASCIISLPSANARMNTGSFTRPLTD